MKRAVALLALVLLFPCFVHTQPQPAFPKELTGDVLYQSGLNMAAAGKYREAVPYFQEAARRKANFAEAYFQVGRCYYKLSDMPNARVNLVTAKYLTDDENLRGEIDGMLANPPVPAEKPAPAGTDAPPAETPVVREQTVSDQDALLLLQKQREAQEKEAQAWLAGLGIRGKMIKDGFSVDDITDEGSENTGLDKGDIIVLANGVKFYNTYELMGKLKQRSTVIPLTVFAGTELKKLSWPPVYEKDLAPEDARSIALNYGLGRDSRDQNVYGQALDYFSRALSVSLNYPYRADIFLDMIKVNSARTQDSFDKLGKLLPNLQLTKGQEPNYTATVVEQGQALAADAARYLASARRYLPELALEMGRQGAASKTPAAFSADLAAVSEVLNKQAATLSTDAFVVQNAADELGRRDFSKWLTVSGAKGWWDLVSLRRGRTITLKVELTIANRSDSYFFQGLSVDIKIVDPAGDIVDTFGTQSGGILAGQNTTLLVESKKTFGVAGDGTFSPTGQKRVQMETYLPACRIRVYIGGKDFGTFKFGAGAGTIAPAWTY